MSQYETFEVQVEEDAETCPSCQEPFGALCDGVHVRCTKHGRDVGSAFRDGECVDCLAEGM